MKYLSYSNFRNYIDYSFISPSLKKKPSRSFREGFLLPYNDILLLVAFSTVGGVLYAESLATIVACAAELPGLHVLHGYHVGALLHLEKARLMTIRTLGTRVRVRLAVKNHLAGTLGFELNGLAGRNCESCNGENEHNNSYDCYDKKLLHCEFHLLSSIVWCFIQ